jgi:hypothetical protein
LKPYKSHSKPTFRDIDVIKDLGTMQKFASKKGAKKIIFIILQRP